MGNDPALVTHGKKLANSFFAVVAVVERALIYVHADEAVGHLWIKIPRELHRILESGFTVIERVLDAVPQCLGNGEHHIRPQAAPNRITAQRQRKAGLLPPPLPEIDYLVQTAGPIGQLAFVDDEACVKIPRNHLRNDLVKGNGNSLNLRREQLQSKVGSGQSSRNSEPHALYLIGRKPL